MSENIIECKDISYSYGKKTLYSHLNFNVKKGRVTGLLGKNGVGKSTLINIITGNLQPSGGECLILGKSINDLLPAQKARIAFLYEGHVCYDFLSIKEIERLYAAFYQKQWQEDLYYELIDKMSVSYNQKINTLSCGQKSQVVLGLIFAQNPDIVILDDYSMGLDAGYRRLFVEYLGDFIKSGNKSVLLTTHIVADLEELIDDIVILQNNKEPFIDSLANFRKQMKGYEVARDYETCGLNITSEVSHNGRRKIFGFLGEGIQGAEISLSFEEAFLGFVGRY